MALNNNNQSYYRHMEDHGRNYKSHCSLMGTLLNFEVPEAELCEFLSNKRNELSTSDFSSDKLQVTKVRNGIVYYYDGVYCLGNKNNKINQIIITGLNRHSVSIIETKRIKKIKRKLLMN